MAAYRFRANSAQIRQSRPDAGLGLSHFLGEGLEDLSSCSLLTRHRTRAEMCSGSEAGSYLRLIDSCITRLKAQGPSRTCNESEEEEEEGSGQNTHRADNPACRRHISAGRRRTDQPPPPQVPEKIDWSQRLVRRRTDQMTTSHGPTGRHRTDHPPWSQDVCKGAHHTDQPPGTGACCDEYRRESETVARCATLGRSQDVYK